MLIRADRSRARATTTCAIRAVKEKEQRDDAMRRVFWARIDVVFDGHWGVGDSFFSWLGCAE